VQKFWELMEKSVIVQATVTAALVGTACYLWATGQPVPTLLAGTLGTVLGFWFGTKVQQWVNDKARRER